MFFMRKPKTNSEKILALAKKAARKVGLKTKLVVVQSTEKSYGMSYEVAYDSKFVTMFIAYDWENYDIARQLATMPTELEEKFMGIAIRG